MIICWSSLNGLRQSLSEDGQGWALVTDWVEEELGRGAGVIREHSREKLGLEGRILAGKMF